VELVGSAALDPSPARAVVREEVLERREQERAELAFRRIDPRQEVPAQEVRQELLGEVLGVLTGDPPAAKEGMEGRPVNGEELVELAAGVRARTTAGAGPLERDDQSTLPFTRPVA
jgi:hypothetical protein